MFLREPLARSTLNFKGRRRVVKDQRERNASKPFDPRNLRATVRSSATTHELPYSCAIFETLNNGYRKQGKQVGVTDLQVHWTDCNVSRLSTAS